MQENTQQSKFMVLMKKIWPYIQRAINVTIYFVVNLIKNFFKTAGQMIKGA
jgi:hypothetical protein